MSRPPPVRRSESESQPEINLVDFPQLPFLNILSRLDVNDIVNLSYLNKQDFDQFLYFKFPKSPSPYQYHATF